MEIKFDSKNRRNQIPRKAFLRILDSFNTAPSHLRLAMFQAALEEALVLEEARLLFVWTGVHAGFGRAAFKHWEKKALEQAHALQKYNFVWETFRYFHALAPSGSAAEKLIEQLWFNHPKVQAWLAKPAGQGVVCATPIS